MKLKIKVKVLTEGCMPEISSNGEWIDLRAASDIEVKAAQAGILHQKDKEKFRNVTMSVNYIPLGVAMELPKGFEAIVASRSSAPKKSKVLIPNGIGIIDNNYNGDSDQWYYVASAMDSTLIKKGTRLCQFRIQLSQKATVWQKFKWLFSSGVKLIEVNNLSNKARGGLGSTGVI